MKFFTYYGDLTDTGNIDKLVNLVKPDEIYYLGAQSHVRVSFDIPEYTCNVGALGTLRILEAIKNSGLSIKFYNASSPEQFGAFHKTMDNTRLKEIFNWVPPTGPREGIEKTVQWYVKEAII